jgi:hypothetical protein
MRIPNLFTQNLPYQKWVTFTQKWYGKKWVRLNRRTLGPAQDWLPDSGSSPLVDSDKCLEILRGASLHYVFVLRA